MEIKDRIKQVRKALNLTQTEFGNKINRSLRAIQNYESGGRSINGDLLLDLNSILHVNIDWLKTGEGYMFTSNTNEKEPINNNIEELGYAKIRFYNDIKASAGTGAFVGMEDYEFTYINKNIINISSSSVIITVAGDSMEPTLYNNDKVIIDINDKYELMKNRIYVIQKDNELYIKRFHDSINGMHIFTSDNPKYDSIILQEYENNCIVGRLKNIINREFN